MLGVSASGGVVVVSNTDGQTFIHNRDGDVLHTIDVGVSDLHMTEGVLHTDPIGEASTVYAPVG